jgi:hypothetical protein
MRFIATADPNDQDLLALWIFHTYLCEETYTTPRLLIDSPFPGSGKTTLLEHLNKLCFRPVPMASVSSASLLVRLLKDGVRTLLIDEADRSLDPRDPKTKDLIAILNSGYKRGATRPVNTPQKGGGWDQVEMSTYAPVAMAGNNPKLPDDTRTRCITIRLLPAREEQIEPSDWEYLDEDAEALADKIAAITETHREQVKQTRAELPDGTINRLAERWRPLKRIASVAGGEWPNKVDALILKDIEAERVLAENGDAQVSTNVHLARDLKVIFDGTPDRLPTSQIVKVLIALNPEQWSSQSYYGKDLTAQRLGRLLVSGYGINSLRLNENTRGYSPTQFAEIWKAPGVLSNKPTEPTEPTGTDLDLF